MPALYRVLSMVVCLLLCSNVVTAGFFVLWPAHSCEIAKEDVYFACVIVGVLALKGLTADLDVALI
jgi:hypothetical protein